MTYSKFRTLCASVGVMAFAFASGEVSARPAASRGAVVAAHPIARPLTAHSFRHRHGNFFWPGFAGDFYGSNGYGPNGAPLTDLTPPASSDVRYTYDVPWDWAHRYPPNVVPSERPYVPGCRAESVTVPGREGADHVVNVTRCY
jgi:hypothetical protein